MNRNERVRLVRSIAEQSGKSPEAVLKACAPSWGMDSGEVIHTLAALAQPQAPTHTPDPGARAQYEAQEAARKEAQRRSDWEAYRSWVELKKTNPLKASFILTDEAQSAAIFRGRAVDASFTDHTHEPPPKDAA